MADYLPLLRELVVSSFSSLRIWIFFTVASLSFAVPAVRGERSALSLGLTVPEASSIRPRYQHVLAGWSANTSTARGLLRRHRGSAVYLTANGGSNPWAQAPGGGGS